MVLEREDDQWFSKKSFQQSVLPTFGDILQKAFFKHVLECIYLKVYRENEKYGIKEFW